MPCAAVNDIGELARTEQMAASKLVQQLPGRRPRWSACRSPSTMCGRTRRAPRRRSANTPTKCWEACRSDGPRPVPCPLAPWRIGVDVGGTFTDMVLRDAAGAVRIFKSPSVPADPSEGVLGVLRLAAQQLDITLTALLRDCALFVHGSTVATNTILEKKGAKVGMLTTEGFRDSLEIRRGIRENQWDHRAPFPQVLVPRYLRLPVRGRIGADGEELAPLSPEDVDAAAKVFAEPKASSRSRSACSIPSSTARTNAPSAPARQEPGTASGSRCRARSCRPWASTSAARPPS